MDAAPIAPLTIPSSPRGPELREEFFGAVLGPHRKDSCCQFAAVDTTLPVAEADSLHLNCQRAGLVNGQDVLELGCGWGSLAMWIASHYPASRITAVSNSPAQCAHVERRAAARGLANLQVINRDMNDFDAGRKFDRVVSVGMFEHMRNWRSLLSRVAGWLHDDGRFFMQVFCHRAVPYACEGQETNDWRSPHYYAGGMVPSDELPLRFQDQLQLETRWRWDGRHCQRTANAWLANMDARRATIWPMLEQACGSGEAQRCWSRWRMFLMVRAEMGRYDGGRQWAASDYLYSHRLRPGA